MTKIEFLNCGITDVRLQLLLDGDCSWPSAETFTLSSTPEDHRDAEAVKAQGFQLDKQPLTDEGAKTLAGVREFVNESPAGAASS